MFYKVYKRLCQERGESITGVARRLGISPNTAASWASGAEPRNSTKRKIALYFDVPVSYFDDDDELTDTIEDTPLVRDFIKEMQKDLNDDERLLIDMFRTMSSEKKQELLRAAMRMKLEDEK